MIHIILGIILILAALLFAALLYILIVTAKMHWGGSFLTASSCLFFVVTSIAFSVMLASGKGGIYGWCALAVILFMIFGIIANLHKGYERRHSTAESQDESQDA